VVDVSADSGREPDPHAWTGPWADDARRLFQVIQGEGIAALRKAGPEVLDRVSELAAGLAATLRSLDLDPEPDVDPEPGVDPLESAPGLPPSTVRINVTD
jgi:hypothetical protein